MLRWTAEHIGIKGNERVDKAAKVTAGGITTALDDITPSRVFLDLISNSELTHKASSTITQICIGHLLLNTSP
jgi:hypothetical protein